MKIIERIVHCLEEKNKSMSDLCEYLQVSTSTMGTWKIRKTDPPAKYIASIATFLGVELEWILTGEVSKKGQQAEALYLFEDEIKLIEDIRKCDPKDQGRIMGMAEGYAQKNYEAKDKQEKSQKKLSAYKAIERNEKNHKII